MFGIYGKKDKQARQISSEEMYRCCLRAWERLAAR